MLTAITFEKEMEALLIALLATLPRLYGFLATAPLLNQATITRVGRIGVIIVLAIPVVPLVQSQMAGIAFKNVYFITPFFLKEIIVGYLMGYTVGWLFWAVQTVGVLIDNQRGASIAESIDPLQGHQSSPLGNLFSQVFTTYLFTTGGVLYIIGTVYYTYQLWPVTKLLPVFSGALPVLALEIMDYGQRLMFILAAPVVGIMFLAEFALAMVSRFAPQIQVFILAMPIKSGLAILVLIFYVSLFIPETERQKTQTRDFSGQMLQIFESGDILGAASSEEKERNPSEGKVP